MNSLIKPIGFLLLITILLSGLTTISDDIPQLPQNPGNDTHKSNFTEWVNQTPSKVDGVAPQVRFFGSSQQDAPKITKPVADFSANVTSGLTPLDVKFSDISTGATSWAWDVDGDGVIDSNDAVFVYTYTVPGTYNVSLTATNSGGSDTITRIEYITVQLPEQEPILPVANFTSNVTSGFIPLSVQFTDISLNAANVSWDVNGDGVEDSNMSEFVYVYNSAGTYNVSVTAMNTNGTDTKVVLDLITVNEPELGPSISIEKYTNGQDADSGTGPVLVVGSDIVWSYVVTNTGSEVLTSLVVTDNMEGFIGFISTLGVGESQTLLKNGTATQGQYANIGYVQSSLGVSSEVMGLNGAPSDDFDGVRDSDPSHYLGISPDLILPNADFSMNVSSGVAPLDVKFTDQSENATTVSWDVNGDGIEDSNASEFVYTFNAPGTYNVSLKATNPNGTDVVFDLVKAYPTEEIPEFPTIALPVLSILGLMFFMQRRK